MFVCALVWEFDECRRVIKVALCNYMTGFQLVKLYRSDRASFPWQGT
ncbi:hypothetical protein BVRB_1g009640 [Beta vulgaris subsp. vulgaris]|nr:hypothetical protein BVRB_1g009640 [Beta vulgaris subsp. vulgaris]